MSKKIIYWTDDGLGLTKLKQIILTQNVRSATDKASNRVK